MGFDSRWMKAVDDETVHLVVTSPPYWNIKDYGNPRQIGYRDSLPGYIQKLSKVWDECLRVLQPGCRMCIRDGFLRIPPKLVCQLQLRIHCHLQEKGASSKTT